MARTEEAQFGPHATYVEIDVRKSFHWAYAVDADESEVPGRRFENRQADVDALLREADEGALVQIYREQLRRCERKRQQVSPTTPRYAQ